MYRTFSHIRARLLVRTIIHVVLRTQVRLGIRLHRLLIGVSSCVKCFVLVFMQDILRVSMRPCLFILPVIAQSATDYRQGIGKLPTSRDRPQR